MALIVVGIIFYLIFYFNVFLEYFKVALEKVFYSVNLFKNFLSIITEATLRCRQSPLGSINKRF